MRVLAAALATIVSSPGCIAWRSHVDPGVAEWPESARAAGRSPARARVSLVLRRQARGEEVPALDPERTTAATETLSRLLLEANLVSEAGPGVGFADLVLRVVVTEREKGSRTMATITFASLGLVPFFGGVEVEAECEAIGPDGKTLATYQGRAEVTQVAHLLLLAAWNAGALASCSTDALKSVVVQVSRDRERLLGPPR
ncbi:MAG: hypothetical protein L0216_20365 [Planctomycetales bacterium]|nr:hypothetical protein [Planctomycetales bacterium]